LVIAGFLKAEKRENSGSKLIMIQWEKFSNLPQNFFKSKPNEKDLILVLLKPEVCAGLM